jgi:hypothetical protein
MHQFRFAVFWVVVPLLTAILVFAQAKEMGYEERSQIDSALGQISKDVVQTLQRPQAARYRLVFESSGDAPKDPGRKALNMAITRVAAVLDSLIAGRQDEYSFADTKIHFAEIGRGPCHPKAAVVHV